MIADLLPVPYRDYGRDLSGLDCWGLVCMVRQRIRSDELPSFLVNPGDKQAVTRSALDLFAGGFVETQHPEPGAVVTVWRGVLCLHAAIVIDVRGRLAVLETNPGTGVRWKYRRDFERLYLSVKYHDNHH